MRFSPVLLGASLLLAVSAAVGQTPDPYNTFPFTRQRATNLARMQAERLNGGLSVYRPDACMYNRAAAGCLIVADAEGYTFRFLGGPPGWQVLGLPPTTETELRISADGRQVLSVLFNGAPRPTTAPQAVPLQPATPDAPAPL